MKIIPPVNGGKIKSGGKDDNFFLLSKTSIHRSLRIRKLSPPEGDLEEMATPTPQISVGNTWGELDIYIVVRLQFFFLCSHGLPIAASPLQIVLTVLVIQDHCELSSFIIATANCIAVS